METIDSASLPSSQEVPMLLAAPRTLSSKWGEGRKETERRPRSTRYQLRVCEPAPSQWEGGAASAHLRSLGGSEGRRPGVKGDAGAGTRGAARAHSSDSDASHCHFQRRPRWAAVKARDRPDPEDSVGTATQSDLKKDTQLICVCVCAQPSLKLTLCCNPAPLQFGKKASRALKLASPK